MRAEPERRVVRYAVRGWGHGEIVFVGEMPVEHAGPGRSRPRGPGPERPPERDLVDRLVAYFGGAREQFGDVDLDAALAYHGIDGFAGRVLSALRAIPYGSTISYGELAELAGFPGAARAAGTVLANGPLEIIVPYHRVVRSDGSVGSYGPGAGDRKRRLLALEARALGGVV